MGVDNRLSAGQLTALEPGDVVVIESEVGLGRPRHATGTVVRVTGPDIIVKVPSRYGAAHQERYRRRDGLRVGGVSRAELVNADVGDHAAISEEGQEVQRIHGLYRAWNRNRDDVNTLEQLHAAIGELLGRERAVVGG